MRTINLTVIVVMALGGLGPACVTQGKYDTLASKLKDTESTLAKREERIKQLDREIAEVTAALKRTRAQLAEVRASLSKDLASKQAMLEKQRAELEAKLAELQKTRAALEELDRIKKEMARQRELNEQLTRQFQKMISAGQLKLVNRRGRLVIQMKSQILFPSGRAEFTKEGQRTLTELAGILRNIDQHFQVAGHTDNVAIHTRKYEDNWSLSGHRATVVVRLLEKAGVPGHRLSAAGFSQFDPLGATTARPARPRTGASRSRCSPPSLPPSSCK
jgi:chemotaxis protein MotB